MPLRPQSDPPPIPSSQLVLIGLSGAAWSAGLARSLAQITHLTPFFGMPGTLACAAIGAVVAIAVATVMARRGVYVDAVMFLPLVLPLIDVLAPDFVPWRGPALLAGSVAATIIRGIRVPRSAGLAASFLVPLAVYLPDLSPFVGRADTFEFQVIGPMLGIAHPSGYPLYTLLCKLFSLLPLGTVAWRVNLSSAVFSAAASAFLYEALLVASDALHPWAGTPHPRGERRVGGSARAIAFLSAMTLAFSPTLWSRAIEAEVYALNALLVSAAFWLVVKWHAGDLSPRRAWPALGLVIGLALSSHVTLGALGLVAVAGLAVKRLRPPAKSWLWAILLGLAGLSLYAYIPIRWPAVTGGDWMSLPAFWRFVTNADSAGALQPLAFYRDPARWSQVGRLYLEQVGWAGVAVAAVGAVSLARRRLSLALGFFLTLGAWTWFNLSFYVADPDYSAFLIPAHVVLVTCLGWGALTLNGLLPARWRIARSAGLGLLLVLALSRLWQTGPSLDTAPQGFADETWARYALDQPLPHRAAILADSEKFPPLYFLQQVEGLRTDLDLVTLFDEAQYRADLEARLNAGQAVYLARYLPGMDAFGVSSLGPLVAVGAAAAPAHPVGEEVPFGDQVTLIGYDLAEDPYGRPMYHLTLSWRAGASDVDDLEVRRRLVSLRDGSVVWEMPATRPVGGYTTTRAWAIGQEVTDYHALAWPDWLPAGDYELQVALYPRFGDVGLPVGAGVSPWHSLGDMAVRASRPPAGGTGSPVLVDHAIWLMAPDVPQEAPAGAEIPVDLAWLCDESAASGTEPRALWRSGDGEVTASHALVAVAEASLEETCAAASQGPVRRRYLVRAPAHPGAHDLELFWISLESGGPRPVQCRWFSNAAWSCRVAEVQVAPVGEGLADFDGRVLLLDASIDASEVAAGGQLTLELEWRARQPLQEDYTVFVQVLGPDGAISGQVDSWPVQGIRPTSGWRAGEDIADAYRFYLNDGAARGEQRVIVGWYLLADMTRLPVLDASGHTVGDFVEVARFQLP